MKIHKLKTLPKYFKAQLLGNKQFEVRKNDRDFHVGDVLILEEYQGGYSGVVLYVRVTYVLRGFEGLKDGYVVLSTEPLTEEEIEEVVRNGY